MKIDFVLCYEHWQRELYALESLKILLEKKGYRVRLLNIQPGVNDFLEAYFYEPEVIVFPWVYSNAELKRARNFQGSCQKIVNMQCEQFLSRRVLENGFFKIREHARNAYHISWGRSTHDRFLQYGIEETHIWDIGNINLEMNNKRYDACFESREELAKRYNLDINKKWLLFCSNFKLANLPLKELVDLENRSSNVMFLAREMKRNKSAILKWIVEYLKNHDDIEIIYRPHPIEKQDSKLMYLHKHYPNFKYLPDLTVNQWVRVCQRCATWNSTSILDAVYSGIPSAFFTPYQVPDLLKGDLDYLCKKITNYQEFEAFLTGTSSVNEVIRPECSDYIHLHKKDSIRDLAVKLDRLYQEQGKQYFEQKVTGYSKWRQISLYDKWRLLIHWISKYVNISPFMFSKRNIYEDAYRNKQREKKIYVDMLKE